MTKVDGVPLSSIWNDMEESKWKIVLRLVIDILLELASQRFDKIEMLFQQENPTDPKNSWYIMPYISGFDARYLKWLADEYGVKVVVKIEGLVECSIRVWLIYSLLLAISTFTPHVHFL